MIALVMTVCMIQDMSKCKDVKLNFMAEHVTPQQCMMYGQAEMAKWIEMHPNWKITKWGCSKVKEDLEA